jgi:hypothetical protein
MSVDKRYTIATAAIVSDRSEATIRRRVKDNQLPGAGPDAGDRSGQIWISGAALVAAGLITADQLADDQSDAVITGRRAERERVAEHDELVALRASSAGLAAQNDVLRAQLEAANKIALKLASFSVTGRAA